MMSATKEPAIVLDMDSLHNKRRLLTKIQNLKGVWEFQMRQRKSKRSLNANAYYWAAFIPGWLEWMREASGEPWISPEQAHEALVARVLGTTPIVNKETGEVIDEVRPRTSAMDSSEFGQYLDRAAEFLASFCSIVVLPPEVYFEERDKGYVNRSNNKRASIAA
jgi:hypothetical protein